MPKSGTVMPTSFRLKYPSESAFSPLAARRSPNRVAIRHAVLEIVTALRGAGPCLEALTQVLLTGLGTGSTALCLCRRRYVDAHSGYARVSQVRRAVDIGAATESSLRSGLSRDTNGRR